MKRIDTVVKSIFMVILLLTGALFLRALTHSDTEGEAYAGSFDSYRISDGWFITYADGTTVGGIRLPMETHQHKGEPVVLRHHLPENIRDGMRMCIRAQRQDVYIFINGSERGRYNAESNTGFIRRSPESAFVLADLYEEDASGELVIELVPRTSEKIRFHEVTYAYGNNVWFTYVFANLPMLVTAVILILAGVFSAFAYLFMRKRLLSVITVLRLAEALIVAGMWMLAESELRQIIFKSPAYSSIFSFLLIEMMPPLLLMYFNEIQEHRYEREYVLFETGMLSQLLLNSLLNFSGVASYYDTLIYSHILALMSILWAIFTIATDLRSRRIRKYSITAVGMLLLLVFGIAEIVNFYLSSSIGFGVYLGLGLLALLGATAMQTAKDEMLRREQKRHADNANRAKSFFLANMSHEIRTPINAILGMDEMILRESADEQIRSYAGDIRDAGKTLLSLINDILDFSKIEEGRMEIHPTQYDLTTVINDLVSMIRSRAEVKGLRFIVHVDESTPQILYGDEIRIRQCALNLLTNAVKYTEKGSVTLDIGYTRWGEDKILLKFRVSDTGIGMRKEHLDKLFTPFFRAEEKRNRAIEGTGLGMNITRQLLRLMGSDLDVDSVYGEGSTFAFAVEQPVVKWDSIGKFTGHYEVDAAQRTYRARLHAPEADILVIDDTPLNLSVVKGLLKKTEVRIDTAESGPEAIEMAARKHYDVIFVDHMMPGMDGIETLGELKKLPDAQNTVYVALTANALSGSRERYLAVGFTDYLSKPVDGEKLEEMLLTYLPPEKCREEAADVPEEKPEAQSKLRALIVDDDEALCHMAGDILGRSFQVTTCSGGADALRQAESLRPDVILLDVDSGQMNGFEVLRALRERPDTSDIPVIFLTDARDEESEIACFRSGAADFVRKPFVPEVLLQRTRRIVALDRLQHGLQSEVRRQTLRAERLSREMMLALSKAVDAKDHYTNGHSLRVAAYAAEIARRMGKTPQEQSQLYEMGLMHDIGKIGVSEDLINKDEHLTAEEFEQIKRHTIIGSEILSLITQMPELAGGARSHHEHYDGTGYPDGLKGTDIPETARILCVADSYDAMTSTRIYSPCWTQDAVREEFKRCSGTQFDPNIAKVMLAMIDEDTDYRMTERTADISVWKGSEALWLDAEAQPQEKPRADDGLFPEDEDSTLPEWLRKIDGLDISVGLRHCGTEETYLETLGIYAGSVSANAEEIERFSREGDMGGVITKVHALKSTSRAIGAAALGDFAERLELAGKAGDTQQMLGGLDELLMRYRALGGQLAPLCAAQEEDESLPLLEEEKVREAYDAMREVLSSMDFDSVEYLANYLRGYRIPESERERCSRILRAADDFDWEKIGELLN